MQSPRSGRPPFSLRFHLVSFQFPQMVTLKTRSLKVAWLSQNLLLTPSIFYGVLEQPLMCWNSHQRLQRMRVSWCLGRLFVGAKKGKNLEAREIFIYIYTFKKIVWLEYERFWKESVSSSVIITWWTMRTEETPTCHPSTLSSSHCMVAYDSCLFNIFHLS